MTANLWKRITAVLLSVNLLLTNATHAGTVVTYVHTDHLGSPVAETNSLGNITWRRSHSPYGEDEQGPTPDGPRFTGHRNDAATGLVYMQARYYDAEIGRFLSVDPVTFSPDKPQQFNRYWYANGNPYVYTDPDGESAWMLAGAAIGGGLNLATQLYSNGGDWNNVSWGKVGVAAAAGAVGVGAASAIAASVAGAGITGGSALAANIAGNAIVGAEIGAASTVANAVIDTPDGGSSDLTLGDVARGATTGAVTGALGTVAGSAVSAGVKAANNGVFGAAGEVNGVGKLAVEAVGDVLSNSGDAVNEALREDK